ncbi:carotenoid oxygenase [Colletotrichum godetiae]|uniref:Carotenoid oxygenase n=1 Tax=Colletotrichum godetiae TaxID=1209918 RepID=A0AAJ0AKS3_9PEZI|nr:carotenoid oxygenase [Colletotrichum godetiae]KAK1675050.1 carotenoid oxygenase [Colletotrichum godetiae]
MTGSSKILSSLKVRQETNFPATPFFDGPEAPCRFEAEVCNCIVRGSIPEEINGTYYRCMPDWTWAPLYDDDVFINGDGAIDAVRIRDGHADFKQKYVRTAKFNIERAARQSVFGKYRNRHTDDPRVKHEVHSTANTHIVYFENQLLALKEDSRPYAMDPDSLETRGLYDFHGQYSAPTFTAHPKIDPDTGELITMGYEAKGDATNDVAYYLFDKNGKKLEECWIKTPYVGMMHDMAATKNWILFVLIPLETQPVEILQQGSKHFAWAEDKALTFGLLPRRNPKPEDVLWFNFKNAFYGHTGNAFEGEDGCIYLDAPLTHHNKFWFFGPRGEDQFSHPSGKPAAGQPASSYVRWKLDPNATNFNVEPTELVALDGEMPKVDERFATKAYSKLFLCVHDPKAKYSPVGGTYNTIAAADINTGKYTHWSAGEHTSVHEVAFLPRSPDAAEGDGFLVTIANRRDVKLSCILILDTKNLGTGPVAIIELPFRLRNGIHGSWIRQKFQGIAVQPALHK